MKTLKLIITASIVLFYNIALSQSYFNSSKELVPLYTPFHSGVDDDETERRVYLDLSEVNNTNGRLDLVGGVSEYQLKVIPTINYYDVNASLYLNSNDSNFNDLSSTFTSQNLVINGGDPGGYNRIKDILFTQLRSSAKKDVVV